MTSFFRFLVSVFVLSLAVALPAHAAEGHSDHIKARLIAESATVAPGGQILVGLDYEAVKGWHTYWINPGDTGLAPKVTWNLPDHVTAGDIQWPTPTLLPAFGLMSYGYDGPTTLLIPLNNQSTLGAGNILPIKAHVDFLVCADVCIPESLEVSLNLKVGSPSPGPDAGPLARARAAVPQAKGPAGTVDLRNGVVELGFPTALEGRGAYFFPSQADLVSAPAPQALDLGAQGFALRVKSAGDALPEGPLSGVLKLADGTAYDVALTRAPLSPAVHGLGDAPQNKQDTSVGGIVIAMVFAFLGGLILNLMPCVFPVLSMKLLSLSRAGHDQGLAQTEALVYGAGAIVSFVALALMLQVAHMLGASLGWGFQLQSPFVTALLALVMLLVALNMSGVFEIGASLQSAAGVSFDAKRPLLAAFFTGVLAVVVAAPCTAPFMATAIGVALAQGGFTSFAIFVALGLGFALPFVALTFLITLVPGVAGALPKPGKWMDWLKHALSLLMYAAAAWLIWVFAQQVQTLGLVILLVALAAVTAGVLNLPLPKFAKSLLLVAGVALCIFAAMQPQGSKLHAMPSGLPPHQDFHVDTLAQLRSQNTPVLVDLTAAWCVTCKVNERLVMATAPFQKAMKETGTVYMVGDWTNQDSEISHYLTLYGRSGVPLYVYYGRNNAEPKVLPQILNTDAVVKVLRAGA